MHMSITAEVIQGLNRNRASGSVAGSTRKNASTPPKITSRPRSQSSSLLSGLGRGSGQSAAPLAMKRQRRTSHGNQMPESDT